MNWKRAKERSMQPIVVESPVALHPLIEFVLGLFEKKKGQKKKNDAEEGGR